MRKPLAFPRSHYQTEVCLSEGKIFKSSGHWLQSWLTDCPPHAAQGSTPATGIQLCAHPNWKRYALAALNSSLSHWIIWYKGWTTKYCVCLSKMERNWEIKRKFSCQHFLFKTCIRIKIPCRQVQLSPLWDAKYFWLRLFLQWPQLFSSQELINKKQRVICASQCKRGQKNPEELNCCLSRGKAAFLSAGGGTDSTWE